MTVCLFTGDVSQDVIHQGPGFYLSGSSIEVKQLNSVVKFNADNI